MLEDFSLQLRAILAELKHWPDQRAHAERRRDALERAAAIGHPRGIVVMCLGNICCSPYAEHRLRQLLAGTELAAVSIRSAGLIGPGRPSPANAQAVAAQRGLDLKAHVSETLTPELVAQADVVLVMATSQARALSGRVAVRTERIFILGDFDPELIRRREIHDPFKGDADVFSASYDRIDRCLADFVEALRDGWAGEAR